jgi:hypothetical protein
MGIHPSRALSGFLSRNERRLLLLGLDNAGKTSALLQSFGYDAPLSFCGISSNPSKFGAPFFFIQPFPSTFARRTVALSLVRAPRRQRSRARAVLL